MSVNYLSLGDFNAEEKENGKQTMGYSLRGFTVKNRNKNKTMRKTKDNNNNQIVDHIDEMKDDGLNYVDCKYSQLEMFNELNVEHSEDEVEKKGKKSMIITIGIVCFLLVMIIFMQFKVVQESQESNIEILYK